MPKFFHYQDLFYISPFYHLMFPMKKFIITDADIEFMSGGVEALHKEFNNFSQDQLFAFAKDMSPFYRTMMFKYRQMNKETRIGDPGEMQGINSGVALLNLEKMRKSDTFNKYLENDFIGSLCQKYLFKGFIGDQVRCIVISSLYLIIYFEGLVEHCYLGQSKSKLLS